MLRIFNDSYKDFVILGILRIPAHSKKNCLKATIGPTAIGYADASRQTFNLSNERYWISAQHCATKVEKYWIFQSGSISLPYILVWGSYAGGDTRLAKESAFAAPGRPGFE